MTSPQAPAPLSVEEIASELNQADPAQVIELATACLATDPEIVVTRPPTVGSVVTQVREPIAGRRFILADVLACRAEVALRGRPGWAMRMGSDRKATLAAAVCAAEVAGTGPRSEEVIRLCRETRRSRELARTAEWERLAPSIVEFEEIP